MLHIAIFEGEKWVSRRGVWNDELIDAVRTGALFW